MLCRLFGWRLDYVLSLPLPVFVELVSRRNQLFAETARREVFPAVRAALNGGEDVRDLIDACGQVVLKREYYFSRKAIERAEKQAREVAAQVAAGKI